MKYRRFHIGVVVVRTTGFETSLESRLAKDLLLLRLLREEHRVDVREHAARGDRHAAEELVELLVVADREDEVAERLLRTDADDSMHINAYAALAT